MPKVSPHQLSAKDTPKDRKPAARSPRARPLPPDAAVDHVLNLPYGAPTVSQAVAFIEGKRATTKNRNHAAPYGKGHNIPADTSKWGTALPTYAEIPRGLPPEVRRALNVTAAALAWHGRPRKPKAIKPTFETTKSDPVAKKARKMARRAERLAAGIAPPKQLKKRLAKKAASRLGLPLTA